MMKKRLDKPNPIRAGGTPRILDGSAYFVGGLGFTALGAKGVVVVPIRTGLGWRLGVNVNYLKFTQEATWNPF
jgi:hypothetical protein